MITYQKWFEISTKIKTNHQLLWEKYFSTKKCIANQFLYRTTILLQSETAFPSTYKPYSLLSFQKTSEVQFYNENFLILQFTLITCDIFNSQFTSFEISCLLIKHYKINPMHFLGLIQTVLWVLIDERYCILL